MTFFAKEYLDAKPTEFKELKIKGGVIASVLIVLMMLMLSNQISAETTQPGKAPTATSLVWQTLLVVAAILVSVYLFCLEQIDGLPGIGADIKDRSKPAFRKQINEAHDPDLKL